MSAHVHAFAKVSIPGWCCTVCGRDADERCTERDLDGPCYEGRCVRCRGESMQEALLTSILDRASARAVETGERTAAVVGKVVRS